MVKRIAVFTALVLGYAAAGMALNASQPDQAGSMVTTVTARAHAAQ